MTPCDLFCFSFSFLLGWFLLFLPDIAHRATPGHPPVPPSLCPGFDTGSLPQFLVFIEFRPIPGCRGSISVPIGSVPIQFGRRSDSSFDPINFDAFQESCGTRPISSLVSVSEMLGFVEDSQAFRDPPSFKNLIFLMLLEATSPSMLIQIRFKSDSFRIQFGFKLDSNGTQAGSDSSRIQVRFKSDSGRIQVEFRSDSSWIQMGFKFGQIQVRFRSDSSRIQVGFRSDSSWIQMGFKLGRIRVGFKSDSSQIQVGFRSDSSRIQVGFKSDSGPIQVGFKWDSSWVGFKSDSSQI